MLRYIGFRKQKMTTLFLRRSQTFRNPDEDFVLHGQQPIYREKPMYMSNSTMTTTSRRLCQQTQPSVEGYKDKMYAHSLGEMAHGLEKVSRDVGNTLTRSVTLLEPRHSRSIIRPVSARLSRSLEMSAVEKEINRLYDEEFPKAAISETSPIMSSSRLRQIEKEEEAYYPLTTHDSLAKEFFPVTMSSPFEYEKMKGNLSRSQSEAVSPQRRSRTLSRTRSALTRLRTDAKDQRYERLQEPKYEMIERNNVEKMYLMTAEAPRTGSATVYLTSPYETEIAKLRMERLRIEEERLLELQRLEELEKLRPPKQKWYESTGPEFHYECHKNTELQKSHQKWEDTLRKWEDVKSRTELQNSAEKMICL